MPLNHENSLVADSTVSRSPSPEIKRAAYTYGGRRREREVQVNDLDNSMVSAACSISSRSSTYRTAPHNLDEEVPPSSEASLWPSDNDARDGEDEEDGEDEAPKQKPNNTKYVYDWQKRLKEMDDESDFGDADMDAQLDGGESGRTKKTKKQRSEPIADDKILASQRIDVNKKSTGFKIRPSSPHNGTSNNSFKLVPDNLLSGLRASSASPAVAKGYSHKHSPSPSNSPAAPLPNYTKRRALISDSESESDAKILLVRKSPLHSRLDGAPPLDLSQTQPGSDEDIPTKIVGKSPARRKDKVKPPRMGVQPLALNEEGFTEKMGQSKQHKGGLIKPPTKKELEETAKDRMRIAAEQQVSIRKAEKTSKYSMTAFLASVAAETPAVKDELGPDPIVQFSSPIVQRTIPTTMGMKSQRGPALQAKPSLPEEDIFGQLKTTDSENPFVSYDAGRNLLAGPPNTGQTRAQEQDSPERREARKQALLKEKKRIIAMQASAGYATMRFNDGSGDDDDELEVVHKADPVQLVKDTEKERRTGKHKGVSTIRKQQLILGGVGANRQKAVKEAKKTGPQDLTNLLNTTTPMVDAVLSPAKKRGGKRQLTQTELNHALLKKVQEESIDATKKKEDEWVRRGGRLKDGTVVEGNPGIEAVEEVWKAYAEKGLKEAEKQQRRAERLQEIQDGERQQDEDEDEEGEDYEPEGHGSASSQGSEDEEEMQYSGEEEGIEEDKGYPSGEENAAGDVDTADREEQIVARDADDGDRDLVPFPVRRAPRRARAVVDSGSEDENDENVAQPPTFDGPNLLGEYQNDEDIMPPPAQFPRRPQRFSTSSASMDEANTADEEELNKENIFGADKENQAISQILGPSIRSPVPSSSNLLFGGAVLRGSSLSPSQTTVTRQQTRGDESDDDPFMSPPASRVRTPFTAKLKPFSPRTSKQIQLLSPTLKPFLGNPSKGKAPIRGDDGFTRFSDDDDDDDDEDGELADAFQPGPLFSVSGGFSQLFDSRTQNPTMQKEKASKPSDLGLTQDLNLQAAIKIDDKLLKKADSIFEKEQELLIESAKTKPAEKPELYVNELGFLTQTRPSNNAEVYALSPSQGAIFDSRRSISGVLAGATLTQPGSPLLSLTQRHPLRTLSYSKKSDLEEPDSPEFRPKRLMRKHTTLTSPPSARRSREYGGYHSPNPSVSPKAQRSQEQREGAHTNAFEVLGKKPRTGKGRLNKSEFIQAEAEESDEDDKFGFGLGKTKGDEDEEDGEDLDKTLEALVDDAAMDEETLAAQRVQEKYMEQAEADDAEIEKLHQAAVQGELRKKRRNNALGLDDSDDDSDEDEKNKRIRRKMHKKQKIDRDNIKELGENDATKSFYQVYANDLVDDNKELAYLQESQPQDDDVAMADGDEDARESYEDEGLGGNNASKIRSSGRRNQDEDEDSEKETWDARESSRYISREEIVRKAREFAQMDPSELEDLDPTDVSWIDNAMLQDEDDDSQNIRIKQAPVPRTVRTKSRPSAFNTLSGDINVSSAPVDGNIDANHQPPGRDLARLQNWAKTESRSRTAGTTGRAGAGASITGHTSARARAKNGGGSLRAGAGASSKGDDGELSAKSAKRPLKAAPSILAGVADRSARFK